MIQQLEIFASGVSTPPFNITSQDARDDYIQIKKIDGLDPVKATISKSDSTSISGEIIDGVNVPGRNIVLTIGFSPDWRTQTYESLRLALYKYFMPMLEVELRFTSSHVPPVNIFGVVESIDADIWSDDPQCVVSIVCEKAYFKAIEPTVLKGVTSTMQSPKTIDIKNKGSVATGFVLDLFNPADNSGLFENQSLFLSNRTDLYQLLIATGLTLDNGLSYSLSTVEQERFARAIYSETNYNNLLDTVDTSSTWLKLLENENHLVIATTNPNFRWRITYYALFGGL